MGTINAYAKAIIGALIAGLGIIGTALGPGGGHLTGQVWIAAAIAALTALVGVALTTNATAASSPAPAASTVLLPTYVDPAGTVTTLPAGSVPADPVTGAPLPTAPTTPPVAPASQDPSLP